MKDINTIYRDCLKLLKQIGYEPLRPVELKVNSTNASIWGRVTLKRGFPVKLEISNRLLQDGTPDFPAYNTMLHELLHCLPDCIYEGHGYNWKRAAAKVNKVYGYNIQTRSDYSGYNIPHTEKWRIICPGCGHEYYRNRRVFGEISCGFCNSVLPEWSRNLQEITPKRPKEEAPNREPEPVIEGKTPIRFRGKVYYI